MKKIILFLPLCVSLAASANPYAPGSTQWHNYNGMGNEMMQEMNARAAAEQAARQSGQQYAPVQEEIVPAHLRPKWYPVDNFGFIYVGFNPLAAPDIKAPPGAVGYDSLPDAEFAAENAQRLCFERGAWPHDNCQLLFSYRNMCGSVAAGKLRNGRGERYYPSLAIVHTEEESDAAALAHCRADSAVNPQSCEIRGSVGDNCANVSKTMR